jgi:hypothetical protein
MKRYLPQTLYLFLLFILLSTGQARATSILELDLDQVCQRAELIFEGIVVSRKTHLSPTSGNPFTYINFKIIDILKGTYTEPTIELAFMGGQKDGYDINIKGMRMPELGEHGIYFVESTSNEQVNPLIGWDQGHYLIFPDPSNGKKRVMPALKKPSAMILAPNLDDFKQTIRESF